MDLKEINIKELDKLLRYLNIGRSLRFFGGVALLISLWRSTFATLGLKISLITFIFGLFARAVELFNKFLDKKITPQKDDEKIARKERYSVLTQSIIWLAFLTLYVLLINKHIKIL